MAELFNNMASTTLNGAITAIATTITVANGTSFPTAGSGNQFHAAFTDANNNIIEFITVTAVSGVNNVTWTVVRASESAAAFPAGAWASLTNIVEVVPASVYTSFYSASNPPPYPVTTVAGRTGAVVIGAADVGAGTFPGTMNAPAFGVQGASAGFNFTARDNSRTWTLYSQTGTATLYNGTTDVFTVDPSGNFNTAGTVSENGVRVYSSSNPPPYPVTSVAGRTGAVTLAAADVDTSAMRFVQTIITTSESTATTTGYVNLTTVGPQATVTVPPSGSIKVTFGSEMFNGTAGQLCRASILAQDLSNGSATVFTPSDNESAEHVSSTANASNHSTCVFVLGGLTVGHSILFSMQYKAGGGTANFQKRILIVEPCI